MHQVVGGVRMLGPDDRGAVDALGIVGHRQHGEGAGRQEMLDRHALMRLGMRHDADHRLLPVGEAARRDAQLLAGEGAAAVGADHQVGPHHPSVGQGHGGVAGAGLDRHHLGRGDVAHRRQGVQPLELRQPQQPVLDDMAEGRAVRFAGHLLMVEMQEHRGPAIGDADVEDRLGLARHRIPQPGRGDDPARAVGQRGGAAVEGRQGAGRRRLLVQDHGVDPGLAEGGRHGRPGEAAADHRDLGAQGSAVVHGAQHRSALPRCPVAACHMTGCPAAVSW